MTITYTIYSIIHFLENHFDLALDFFSKYDRRFEKKKSLKSITKQKYNTKSSINNVDCSLECCKISSDKAKACETNDFFSNQQDLLPEIKTLLNSTDDTIETQKQRYIKVFLIMYLGYLNELALVKLSAHFGNLESRKIGFVLSLEKKLLHDIIGSKKNFRELLFASGILQNQNDSRKVQIITRGESLLPVLSQESDLELPLKSYFALSQLHTTYIQITLHQVVKTATGEEEAASITIQDEFVPIENMYDALAKNIWNRIKVTEDLINCCPLHEDNFMSLRNYKEFMAKMKLCISEKVSTKFVFN